ncbi:hypothetical protein HG536_0F00130 [Torulaspora globosa]|uniref:L-lactate dehydrogenase n=1 Tax=Torulaspora globosa TaxID=48254 RepID=A0A7G3ZJK3_9SACH|nr:uncharacterized protein HG536_0F00130 [Torulaspora globosa]QLL33689.1 hypothetical protein HG536_0F00130 [Torulaspora globosa]
MSSKMECKPGKIAVVGVGNLGSATAYTLLLKGLAAEIILIDISEKKAEGECMDLCHAVPFSCETQIRVGKCEDCAGCAIVIVAGGENEKPGQSRMDLVSENAKIMQDVIPKIARSSPEAILLIATNPVDVMTSLAQKLSGFPAQRVIGSGTLLDSARFKCNLGKYFKISSKDVNAFVVGEHGDSQVPVWSLASIAGMRLSDYCEQSGTNYDKAALHKIYEQTRDASSKIIECKGSTAYSTAAGLAQIVSAILKDEGVLLPVSTVGDYYGVKNISMSVPVKVGCNGAQHVVKLPLQDEEMKAVQKSAEIIKSVCKQAGCE